MTHPRIVLSVIIIMFFALPAFCQDADSLKTAEPDTLVPPVEAEVSETVPAVEKTPETDAEVSDITPAEEETPAVEAEIEAKIEIEPDAATENEPEVIEEPESDSEAAFEAEVTNEPVPEVNLVIDRREEGNLVIENVPEIPETVKQRYRQYQNVRSAGLHGWDAWGKGMYISTRFAETSQVHYVTQPGGTRSQISYFNEPVGGVSVRPDTMNPGYIFMMDAGGSEVSQMYYYDLTDGSYKMISDGESRYGCVLWYQDGSKFAFVSTKRNGTDFDIYVADMDNISQPQMVYEGKGYWGPSDWSPDGSQLLIYNYISITNSKVMILDIASGSLTPILNQEGEYSMGNAVWRSDGRRIYFTSDFESEFKKLYSHNTKNGKIKLVSEKIDWDISGLRLTPDGKTLAFRANENGTHKIYLMNTFTNWFKQIEAIPSGLIGGLEFDPAGERLGFSLNTPQTPGDVYVYNRNKNNLVRWTFSEVGGLNPDTFIMPEIIEFTTFDTVTGGAKRSIPAYYFKPQGEGPFPVIIYLHGGPEGQFMPYFSSNFNYWVNELGIALIAPNVRGSSGYGKTFLKLDNGFLRENSVKDAGALLDWIDRQPELNNEKIAVFGGSYGGYMVLAMMTNYNDRLAAGVDVVGISNFVTFLENTGKYRQDLRRVEYGDERDPDMREFLTKISPLTNAGKISIPLYVVQGLNDPRVPATEAEQIVDIIRMNEGDVWYLLAKDEGHGFRKKVNRDFYYMSVALFWEEYLLK